MNADPWIGDKSWIQRGVCDFTPHEGEPICGAMAIVHVLSESAIHGEVQLASCDRHAPVARLAGRMLDEHPYDSTCRAGQCLWLRADEE